MRPPPAVLFAACHIPGWWCRFCRSYLHHLPLCVRAVTACSRLPLAEGRTHCPTFIPAATHPCARTACHTARTHTTHPHTCCRPAAVAPLPLRGPTHYTPHTPTCLPPTAHTAGWNSACHTLAISLTPTSLLLLQDKNRKNERRPVCTYTHALARRGGPAMAWRMCGSSCLSSVFTAYVWRVFIFCSCPCILPSTRPRCYSATTLALFSPPWCLSFSFMAILLSLFTRSFLMDVLLSPPIYAVIRRCIAFNTALL